MAKVKCEYCTETAGITIILQRFECDHWSQLTTEHSFRFDQKIGCLSDLIKGKKKPLKCSWQI